MCWCFGGARLSRHRVCRVGRRSQIRFGSSAVHSPSSRAVVARGKVNFFFLWSLKRATACSPGDFFLWAYDKYTYSAGRSSSGNAQSGDVLPACGSGSNEYSEPDLKVSGRGRSSAAGDME